MDRLIRHDRNSRRLFPGQSEADPILRCLNAVGTRDRAVRLTQNRVGAIVKAIRNLLEQMDKTPDWYRPNREPARNVGMAFHSVNLLLQRYRFVVVFFAEEERKRHWGAGEVLRGGYSPVEASAVYAAVKLAERGFFDRLQLCACKRWYFARFSHQRFCSPACRVEFWESSEERKAQKRERARANYAYNKVYKGK